MQKEIFNVQKRVLSALFFAFVYVVNAYSQTFNLSGTIIDKTNNPLEIANILLLNPKDSTFINGTISDTKGYFNIKQSKGKFIVKITSLGYKDKCFDVELFSDRKYNNIALDDDSKQLGEITVTGSKPIIKRSIDRITFDTSNSSASIGGSLMDVLHDVPGVRTTENSISIIGKGQIRVYIDDRETKMSGEELINYLRSYNASQVEKIEVITTPPAKYEAEGNSGIINIKLKYRPKDYIGGTLSLSYNKDEKQEYGNGGINLNMSKNKFDAFINVSGIRGNYARIERANKYFSENTWEGETDFKFTMKPVYSKAGLDYTLDNGLRIGTQITYNHPYNDTDILSNTNIYSSPECVPDSFIYSKAIAWIKTNRTNYNIHADKTWGKNKNNLNWDADYLIMNSKTFNDFISNSRDKDYQAIEGSEFDFNYIERRKIKVISSAIDFEFPWDKQKISFGAKASHTNTKNFMDYGKTSAAAQMQDDEFHYNENIFAAYIEYNREFNDKFSMQTGIRIEHTHTNGKSFSLYQEKKNSYTRLFPTLFFLYNPDKDNVINLNFSNRISRPSQLMVNPFMFFQNRYLYVQGRDDLQPYYTYNTEISYTYINNLNITLYYSYADNAFSQYASMNENDKVSKFFWDNYLTSHKYGISNSYTLRFKGFQTYLQHELGYIRNRSHCASTLPKEESWIYDASIKNTIFLSSAKNLLADITLSYTSPYKDSFYKVGSSYNVSAGLIYKIPKHRINMTLKFNNIFFRDPEARTYADNLLISTNDRSTFRGVMAGITYSIGKDIKSKIRKGSNNDIQNRL